MESRLLLCAALLLGCRERQVTPSVYEIPAAYSGWVTVRYADPGAAPLPRAGGERLFRIPASGALVTSSPQEVGVLHNRYYQVDAAGRRTPVDDVSAHPELGPHAAEQTFPKPVVCCFLTGERTAAGQHQIYYEGFYVGRGPAGQPPAWP